MRRRQILFISIFTIFIFMLTGCGPNIDTMVQNLENPRKEIQNKAVKDLVEIGEPAVSKVIPLLGRKDADVRVAASDVLIEIGEPSIQPLIEVVEDPDTDSLQAGQAVYCLGELGPKFKSKTEATLIKHTDDTRFSVKVNSIAALGKIDSEKGLIKLKQLMESEYEEENPYWDIVSALAQAIGQNGRNDANEILFKFVNDKRTPINIKKDIFTFAENIKTPEMRDMILDYLTKSKKEGRWASQEGMEVMTVIVTTLGSMPKNDAVINVLVDIDKFFNYTDTYHNKVIYALDKLSDEGKDEKVNKIIDNLEQIKEKKKGK